MKSTIFLLILASLIATACPAQYLFDNLKPEDGISSREVRSVYRDAEGFVWMGSMTGLNRYDGSHFKVWNASNPSYPKDLGEMINCITEFEKGIIWFGTEKGVGVYNKVANTISKIPIQRGGKATVEQTYVTQFQQDGNGRLWMSTSHGIFIFQKGSFVPASEVIAGTEALQNVDCYHGGFHYDAVKDRLWIGSVQGMFMLEFPSNTLYSAQHNPQSLPIYNTDRITAVATDTLGNIWYSSISAKSLFYYDFKTGAEEKIRYINNNPLWDLNVGCNTLFIDKTGRLWISTWLYTAFIRNTDGRIEKIAYDETLPYSIGYGYFFDVEEDSFGNLWIATINGVSRFNSSGYVENILKAPSYPFFLTTNFANINTLLPDKNGIWWLGKMEGLVKYDSATNTFERYVLPNKELRWNEIFDVDRIDEEIWCCTGNGIQILNPNTKKFRLFPYFPKDKGNAVKAVSWIQWDSQGIIWIAVWTEGIYRFDPTTKECLLMDGTNSYSGDLTSQYNHLVYYGADQRLWVGVYGGGMRIFDQSLKRFVRAPGEILGKQHITSIREDAKGNIWVSTAEGILKLDRNGVKIDSLTGKEGIAGGRYYDLNFDEMGHLWAISREGLISVQTETKQVTPVKIKVTFSFNDHWNSLIRVGDRLIGTMLDYIVVLDTKKFQRLPRQSSPLISGFKVFQDERSFSRDQPIQLTYRQNYFSIDFSSPFHRESSSIQYAYMLEGFDKDWIYSGRKQSAAYTNVPDGKYTFRVKSTDGSTSWMETSTTIPIVIRAPFWKTAWFMLSILALAAVILWWLIRKRQQRMKEKAVDQTIDYFANSVYGENSVHEICWDIARNCISQLQFEDCVVYLRDDKSGRFIQRAAYGPKNPKGHEIVNPIEIELNVGIVGAVAASGKPILVPDTTKDQRYLVDDLARLSELSVPILHDNKVIGVIDSEHSKKHFFTDDHLKAMTTIASISANKIAEAQAEAHAKENEIKLLEIRKLLAESQLMALRAQMNPHFVFNCLNSIQECIVTQKYGEASNYLNKFSKLFRMVLNNSGKNLVTLDEEKEVLRLYIELEQMRFEKSFEYSLLVDEELEIDEILIPSMLVQPYVENALWHGLMHKDGYRKLTVTFQRVDDDAFRCIIDDNGIGRKRSFELKAQQSKAKRHESKGLKISKDRIEVLRRQGYHATLEMTDKYDELTGDAVGTTVTIELSTFLKN